MNATTSTSQASNEAGSQAGSQQPGTAAAGEPVLGRPQLRRPVNDRMLAGVAAGVADYLDVDVTIVRIVTAILTIAGGAGVALYIAGWLLIPEEGSDRCVADEFIGSLAR